MARVLVIDDEPDVLLLCRVNLEHAGHQVLEAPDGEIGLELARNERPDIIVLDVMLPRRDGLDVLADLISEHAEMPVLLLTAKTQWEDQIRGWRAGAADYITKPFSPANLTEAVERVLAEEPEARVGRRADALRKLIGETPS